jgi:hypothetical protein
MLLPTVFLLYSCGSSDKSVARNEPAPEQAAPQSENQTVPVDLKPTDEALFEFANGTITKYTGRDTEINIPPTFHNGEPLTAIGNNVFADSRLNSVTIPSSVTAIGTRAFANNYLSRVAIPAGVTVIGDGAFFNNDLTGVSIPNNITVIGDNTFGANLLEAITIPDTVTSIGSRAFLSNNLTNIIIPDSVTTIGAEAFNINPLNIITMPANVGIGPSDYSPYRRDSYRAFENFYNNNGKKAGTYTYNKRKDRWNYRR